MATHGVLSGPAIDRLKNSAIARVVITNTLPLPPEKQIDKIEVLSVAGVIADAIDAVFEDTSRQRDLRRREPGLSESASDPEPSDLRLPVARPVVLVRRSIAGALMRPQEPAPPWIVTLTAETGRPTGSSRPARRLRAEGKVPGVVYGHGRSPCGHRRLGASCARPSRPGRPERPDRPSRSTVTTT